MIKQTSTEAPKILANLLDKLVAPIVSPSNASTNSQVKPAVAQVQKKKNISEIMNKFQKGTLGEELRARQL